MRSAAARALIRLDRRSFLRLCAVAATLPTPACRRGPGAAEGPGAGDGGGLTPDQLSVLRAAAERVAGGESAAAIRAGSLDLRPALENFLASAPELAPPLGQALWLLEHGAPLLAGRLGPFTALEGEARDTVLTGLMDSRWALARELFAGIKSVALLGVYGSAAHQPLEQRAGAGVSIQEALGD